MEGQTETKINENGEVTNSLFCSFCSKMGGLRQCDLRQRKQMICYDVSAHTGLFQQLVGFFPGFSSSRIQ